MRQHSSFLTSILSIGIFFLCISLGHAQEGILNKLLAPGPLIKGHAHLEKSDCLKCHEAGQGVSTPKCLECHKDIKPFVDKKVGFHGLAQKSCRECHADHKGREFNSMLIDEKNFDHKRLTGYSLEGKHSEINCKECHTSKMSTKSITPGAIRYFGNQTSCRECHKKDDEHYFKGKWATKDCNACHSLKSWKEGTHFDHFKDTGYELKGHHTELKCSECHNPKQKNGTSKATIYKWPQLKTKQCLTCHENHHINGLSNRFKNGRCDQCHTQVQWKISDFDHKVTRYALKGKHAEIECLECHKPRSSELQKLSDPRFQFHGLKQECLSCHKDHHHFEKHQMGKIKNLNQCQVCHQETGWKNNLRFDHNKHTRYKIDGEHEKLDCLECHIQTDRKKQFLRSVYRWPMLKEKTCENCHKSPHLNQFSEKLLKKACTECHTTSGWYNDKTGKKFDHTKTRFNLNGSHSKISCTECHGKKSNQIFKFKNVNLKFCVDCHSNIHKSQFTDKNNSNDCSHCHSTEKFTERLPYNHNESRFKLEGHHQKLECKDCHTSTSNSVMIEPPNMKKESSENSKNQKTVRLAQFSFPQVRQQECLACHTDYHKRQLGSDCLTCHNQKDWFQTQFDHDLNSDFPLRHKHAKVKCSECHKPVPSLTVSYKNKSVPVKRYKPMPKNCAQCHKDEHSGEFGNQCQECHNERGWKVTKDFHKKFNLSGVHFSLECNECHTHSRKLSGMSDRCILCHMKDDVHNGTLSNCQDCHRQQVWEVTGFKHSLTFFPLRGMHRTLDCMECHRSGSYKGLNSTCSSCHLQEGLAVTTPNHSGFSNINNCQECHRNQFAW